jgi:hypothetical protein
VKLYVPDEVVGYHHLPFSKENACMRNHDYTLCKIIGNIKKRCLHTILDIMATLVENFTVGFLWPWYRRSMMRDKPILVLVSQKVVVLFSMTNIHTSEPNSRIVLLAKVVDAELGITFFITLTFGS